MIDDKMKVHSKAIRLNNGEKKIIIVCHATLFSKHGV